MKNTLIDAVELSKENCQHPIQCQLAYATKENFMGRIVDGYNPAIQNICLLTPKPARALCQVQNELNKQDLGLFVFDAYRPLRAVRDFAQWFQQVPVNAYELERKNIHYPHLQKNELSKHGYVADTVSKHCFGATIDLTLVDLKTNQLLNMGACFDYFDELSHTTVTAEQIGVEAFNNRKILSDAMQQFGYLPYQPEYWHFDYQERETEIPFDFPISVELITETA